MKKILSVLLAVLAVFSAFTGCTKEAEEPSSNSRITVDSHYSSIDSSAMSAYTKLCEAVIAGENEVKFNIQLLDSVCQLFYTSFPLNALVQSLDVSADKTGIELAYKNDADTHSQLVAQFFDKVDEIIEACGGKNVSKDRFVFNVYTYLAQNFQYDETIVTAYDTLINGKGISAAVNSVFEYILLCNGIDAAHVINTVGKGAVASIVKFNQQYYYFDVGSELENTSGKALKYFAMNNKRANTYVAGLFKYTDNQEVLPITDDTYSRLADSVSYTVQDDSIEVDCGSTEPYILNIK